MLEFHINWYHKGIACEEGDGGRHVKQLELVVIEGMVGSLMIIADDGGKHFLSGLIVFSERYVKYS